MRKFPREFLKTKIWSRIGGPLLAAGAAAAIELLSRGVFKIPNPPAIFLLIVVFSAFIGGLGSGLTTALLAWLYFLYFFSSPGQPLHYTDENLRRVVVWAVTTPIMAIMVGVLKRRAARGVEVSRENAALAEQIDERRRAEEVLHESEARYRNLFENVPVGLCRTTPSGQILDANAALVRILGFPDRDMLLAKNITDTYFDPKDRAQKTAQIAREGAVVKFVAYQMRRYDGTPVWVEASGRANYDPQGRVLYFDGVIVDVTDRKREEETRRRSEEERRKGAERYRSLFNGIPVGLYRAAVGGEILEANPAFLRILGCPDLETLRAMNAEDLYVDSEVRQQWISILEREGVVSGFESRLRRLDGSVIWVLASARIVRDASGEASYLEGAAEDITERKQVQDAVVRAREADRANQAKSEFLSRMSHELRTPLNAILGFGQLLEMDSITPKQRDYVADILKGGHHLLDLINEVLEISRIEAGRLTISPEPISVQEVVQESLSLIAPLFAQGNIRLEDGTARIPEQFVWADRQRLKQVLLNLLSNAVKYNRRGGLVALSCEAMPEGRLRMKVSDTGPGIAPERLERLFVPFERLGAEQTTIEGTGLGLALSKRLVEVMGGALGVDSTVDRGSTFWIELALSESPAQQASAAMPGVTELRAPQIAGTVLYVEDNLPNLKLVQKLLALRPEVKVIPAMQGRLGLDLARQHRPELILLDVHLPDINGDEVLRRLKDAPETRHIPVIVISADATQGQIDRLLAAGAQAYLTKPLDVKKLLAVLDETLKREGP